MITLNPGTEDSASIALEFSDGGSAATMNAAADAILERVTARRPELRLTLLGLTSLDRSPVLRHAAAAGGRLNDAHPLRRP